VSPLVRIVEETEKISSSPSNSRSARESSNMSDDPKGKRTMSTETTSFGTPADIPADQHDFGLEGARNIDPGGMQDDLFDGLWE
jgi:hypothetical protein